MRVLSFSSEPLGMTYLVSWSAKWYSSTNSCSDLVRFFFLLPSLSLFDNSHLLRGIKTIIPMAMAMMPTGVKEKKPSVP